VQGDPLEAEAIARVLGKNRSPSNPVIVGSIKTNVGHLEGASGLAGLIKTVLILETGLIPPNLNFEQPNERIPLQQWNLKVSDSLTIADVCHNLPEQVPLETTKWPTAGPRRASVNSFGYGGTNAHVILDDAHSFLQSHGSNQANHISRVALSNLVPNGLSSKSDFSAKDKLYVLYSNDEISGKATAVQLADYLVGHKEVDASLLNNLAFTLANRRSKLPWRACVRASTIEGLVASLEHLKFKRAANVPKLGFVFTGQGAQWYGMGRELLAAYPAFLEKIHAADEILKRLGAQWSIYGMLIHTIYTIHIIDSSNCQLVIDELNKDESSSQVDLPHISQPICTSLQIALVDLLSEWGITPQSVTGHSSGEIAAAYTAGALSFESAIEVAYHRGVLSSYASKIHGQAGSMLAVGLGQSEAEDAITDHVKLGKAMVACVNSPTSVTVSGDSTAISELCTALTASGVFARRLKVKTAYHSHHMSTIAEKYREAMGAVRPESGNGIHFFSSVTGERHDVSKLGADYWVQNMVSPVLFQQSVTSLCSGKQSQSSKRRPRSSGTPDWLIEVGPHSALSGPIRQTLEAAGISKLAYASVLVRNKDTVHTALDFVASLVADGCQVSFESINYPCGSPAGLKVLSDLSSYSWNHGTVHWAESRYSKGYRFRQFPRHDLVGHPVSDFNLLEPRWRNFIRVSENPWVREHQVTNSILYPAAGMIVMAVEAMRQMAKMKPTKLRVSGYELRDINIGKALVIPETNDGVETMLTMRPLNTSSKESSDLWQEFRVFSHGSSEDWTEHCRGRIAYRMESAPTIIDAGREKLAHDEELRLGHAQAQEVCTSRVNVHDMYEALDAIQLSYGETFRNITDMNCGPGQSFGTVEIANVAKVMPYGFEFDYLIHPTTLDSIIQTIFPALAPAGSVIENAIVPTFIERVFISDSISNVAGHQYKTWSSASFQGFKNATATINVAEALEDKLLSLVEIHGLQCSSLVEPTTQDISSKVPKLCFRLDWDTDIDHLTPASTEDMFTVLDVDPAESRTISNLETVSLYYIQQALKDLTAEDILQLDPHHQVFYEWMRSQVESAEAGNLPHQTSHWLDATVEERAEAFDIARNSCCEGRMVYRIGQNLVRILRKEVDPLELMLEDDLLYDVYRDSLGNDRCYRQMVSYIQKLAYKNPTLNVLEIGAGTGGATLPIIQALAHTDSRYAQFAHYDFTDISTGFFEKAQENFKAWSGLMSFKKLNIEEDPLTQGFIEGSYDLIIAANVLHATKSMKTTMENVRRLLKPNGKLVLTEITQRPLRLTMVFGNLPGWWMGAEEGRRHGPSLYDHEWDTLLKKTGFSGLDICRSDYPQDADHVYSVIASSAVISKRSQLPEIFAIMPAHESAIAEHAILRISKMCETSIQRFQIDSIPDVTGAIILFLAEVEQPILTQLPKQEFSNVQRAISTSKLVLWVTTGGSVEGTRAEANVVSGLARAVRAENHALKFITLDLDSHLDSDMEATLTICRIFETATRDIEQNQGVDFEYSERAGKILIPRIFEDTQTNDFIQADINPPVADLEPFSQPGRSLKLEVGVPGLLDTLRFVDDPIMECALAPDEVDISIRATGVNFKDVMVSMGQLVEDFLGCEVAGVITAVGSSVTHVTVGDRVCSWTLGGYGNNIRNDAGFVQRIPDSMSFEHAASLPLVYCTAYYSLFDIGHLAEGDTVLIHAAAGGVGQAAIMLAQHIGAEVYVTVGTEDKRTLVQDRYGIPSDHIFSSRDTTFVSGVMGMTKGRGVDVILNSLAGEPLQQSWDCIARFGRFVEIGKRDIALNGKLNMSNFARNTTFSSVDLTVIIRHNKRLGARILKDVMSLVQQQAVKQVHPITVLGTTEIEVAFRLMQAGKHIGKVVIKSDMDCNVKVKYPRAA
jgi:acyl transferase domain-containing protein/NADPH:quinone reductase-like Zn-dependent oxidoreductase/SAM-dependent methyltransferase